MRKILIALGIVAVAAVIGVAAVEMRPSPKATSPDAPKSFADAPVLPFTVFPEDRVMGDANAPVTIIEYASMTCPHCAHFATEVLPAIKPVLIDSGKVRLVFRDYPLDALALRGAMLVRCAGNERAFGMIELLFSRQAVWAAAQDPKAALLTIANQAGMNEAQFNACMDDKAVQDAVTQSRVTAEQAYKINSTPSFLVNGRLIVGAPMPEEMVALVNTLLPASDAASMPSSSDPSMSSSPSPSSPSSSSPPTSPER
jgi:protein-disulfide isomerase